VSESRDHLVAGFVDGSLSEAEREELMRLVGEDDPAAQDLIDQVTVHRELELVLGVDEGVEARAAERILLYLELQEDGPEFLDKFCARQAASGVVAPAAARERRATKPRPHAATSVAGKPRDATGKVASSMVVAAVLMVAAALVFYTMPTQRERRIVFPPTVEPSRVAEERPRDDTSERPIRRVRPRVEYTRVPRVPDPIFVEPVGPPDEAADVSVEDRAPSAIAMPMRTPRREEAKGAGGFLAYLDVEDGFVERASGEGAWLPVHAGAGLSVGDGLRTAMGRAVVRFETGTVLALDRFTTLTFIADERALPGATVVRGQVYVDVNGRDRGFVVATPHGTLVDLGTKFGVKVRPVTGTNLMVVEGRVRASTDRGTVEVPGAFQVDLDSRIAVPRALRRVPNIAARLSWAAEIPGFGDPAAGFGLVAAFRLDEGVGRDTVDAADAKRVHRIVDGRWVRGRVGTGLAFDGIDGYVLLKRPDLPPPWTVGVWVRRSDDRSNAAILDSKRYSLRIENTNEVGITEYGVFDRRFGFAAPVGRWVHLTFVGTEVDTSLYVNGVFAGTIDETIHAPMWSISSLRKADRMNGTVDEVRVFRRAFTAAEARSLYRRYR
jgi:hypothetical protein